MRRLYTNGTKISDPEQYEQWKVSHECNLNYHASSPNMEKIGAINIFKRSVGKTWVVLHNILWGW